MIFSFIILTWNSERYIEKCLFSLIENLDVEFQPYEIYVVDNGSTDSTRRILENYIRKYPNIVKTILLDTNRGTTFSRNLALKNAVGKYICIIDSDIAVSNNFLVPLVTVLNKSSNIGMVVPRLVYKNGSYQKSTDVFPTIFTKLKRYFFLKINEKRDDKNENRDDYFVDYAISAFWLIKREVVNKVGLLDENIFYAPEDVDYCLRIWQNKYSIVCVPIVEVLHDAQEISRKFRINKAFFEHIKGLLYFFSKHKYLFNKPSFKETNIDISSLGLE